jgi:uncharacterized protein YkwD
MLMTPPCLRSTVAALVCLCLLALAAPAALAKPARRDVSTLLTAINAARAENGVAPLHIDAALNAAATAHTADIAGRGVLDHVGADGADLMTRLVRVGWHGTTAGENLALGYGPRATVQAWLASPGHRQNLLSPAFHRVGLGVAVGQADGQTVRFTTADFSS